MCLATLAHPPASRDLTVCLMNLVPPFLLVIPFLLLSTLDRVMGLERAITFWSYMDGLLLLYTFGFCFLFGIFDS